MPNDIRISALDEDARVNVTIALLEDLNTIDMSGVSTPGIQVMYDGGKLFACLDATIIIGIGETIGLITFGSTFPPNGSRMRLIVFSR